MKAYYMALGLALLLLISFMYILPIGLRSSSDFGVYATGAYFGLVLPVLFYKAFKKAWPEIKPYIVNK